MPKITPGKLYCGSCDTLREFVDGNALDAHVQAMHRDTVTDRRLHRQPPRRPTPWV